jgi:NADPH2:quinone reductase
MTDYAMFVPKPGGADAFERREIATPTPGPGQALVRHTAVGLNFIDVYHRSGLYPWPVDKDLVPGSEGAGVVEAVGEGVTAVRPGDRVAYTLPLNAYASARVIAADRLVKLPAGIADDVAATVMLKGLTAQYLIHSTFRVEPGMHVLVQAAAGGVGLILGQWLSALGAVAIGTAGGPEKVALAKAHGYAHVIDYRAEDFAPKVRELTDGKGVHVVYDSVGKDTWRGSLAALRARGMFVTFGQSSGMIDGFQLADLAVGGASLSACRPSLFAYIATPAELEARAANLFDVLLSGAVKAEVRQRFALSDARGAHEALEGRRTTGATVLVP